LPTIFTHSAFGLGLSKLAIEEGNKQLLMTASLLAALPDADALFIGWVPYGSPFGHRGFTHSLFFAAVVGCLAAFLFLKLKWNGKRSFGVLAPLFALVIASHGFFDAMTTGGLGVAFFAPFDQTRYFFPFRPIPVAPMSAAGLFNERGLHLLATEFALIWSFAVGAVVWKTHHQRRKIIAIICWVGCLLMWVLALR
jgi:inner membrane protein